MVATTRVPGTRNSIVVITRYAPMSAGATFLVFALVSAPILGVAIVCAQMGAWHVLPASMLVVAAVGTGLLVGYRRTQIKEVVTISEKAVAIERGHRYLEEQYELSRNAVRVVTQESARPSDDHVFIDSDRVRIEIGQFLDTDERHQLADKLKSLIGRGGSLGSLAGT